MGAVSGCIRGAKPKGEVIAVASATTTMTVSEKVSEESKPSAPAGETTGNPRNKTALKPGRGLMDWVRLGHSGADLTGIGGRLLEVTLTDLAKHNTRKDAWIALKGKVYNVTPYMEFHPGGEDELMRGAGADATDLFNEVHKWVNFESMLQKCLVGRLVESKSFFTKPTFLPVRKSRDSTAKPKESSSSKNSSITASLGIPTLAPPPRKSPLSSPMSPVTLPMPKYDWFQTDTVVDLAIYTKWKDITKDHVVVVKEEKVVKVVSYIQDMLYTIHIELSKPVEEDYELKLSNASGKVDVLFTKKEAKMRWSNIGKGLTGNNRCVLASSKEAEYVTCNLVSKENITHDTRLFVVEVPSNVHLPVPVGYHVFIRIPGKDLVKPYTPVTAHMNVERREEGMGRLLYFFIKIYSDGALTPSLDTLSVGSTIDISFPEGSFMKDMLSKATSNAVQLILLAAGTGITPMIKLLLLALHNERKTHLVMFNKTLEDIPWHKELETLVSDYPHLFKVTHVLSKPSDSWTGARGHVRKELLEEWLPLPDVSGIFVGACGPSAFTKLALNVVKELGLQEEQIHGFLG
ncbi:cytochrome b5 reductase 4 isoform X2 [Oratosquilla oratoria]|uniref:cytochrome b5 reductase 4 isoform X2 n=1 Tax=Oratosquilla oratoria TaxID=337810 RepID=UPI003F760EA9